MRDVVRGCLLAYPGIADYRRGAGPPLKGDARIKASEGHGLEPSLRKAVAQARRHPVRRRAVAQFDIVAGEAFQAVFQVGDKPGTQHGGVATGLGARHLEGSPGQRNPAVGGPVQEIMVPANPDLRLRHHAAEIVTLGRADAETGPERAHGHVADVQPQGLGTGFGKAVPADPVIAHGSRGFHDRALCPPCVADGQGRAKAVSLA